MNQLQFRGKLAKNTFFLSVLGVETSLCVAHVLFPEDALRKSSTDQNSRSNIFLDSASSSSNESRSDVFTLFQNESLFCPFFKNYKAPFRKTLVLREFHKNGNLQNVLDCNDEIEELYLAFILKSVLIAITKVHAKGFCLVGTSPEQVEVTDDGDLVFPFYYDVKRVSVSLLLQDLRQLKALVRKLTKHPDFGFEDIEKSKFSNRFKDFLKSLFQNYGFEKLLHYDSSTSTQPK